MDHLYFFKILTFLLILPAFSEANGVYKSFVDDKMELGLSGSYFSSSSNFNSSGEKQDLFTKGSLQATSLESSFRYVVVSDFGLFTSLKFNSVDTTSGSSKRANSGLDGLLLGSDFRFYRGDTLQFFVEGSYKFTNTSIDTNTDTAINSDMANEARFSLVGLYKMGSLVLHTKLGLNARSQGLSYLMEYDFGGEYSFSQSFIGGGLSGFTSVKDDEYTSNVSVRDILTNRVNAGSRKFYAVNPAQHSFGAYYGNHFGKNLSCKFGVGLPIAGNNSADGFLLTFGSYWTFGETPLVTGKKKFKTTMENEDDKGFVIDTNDGINQDIFQNSRPTKKK